MVMKPSGLFAVLTALFAAVLIGANIPDGGELGVTELESEVSLLSMLETESNEPNDPDDAYFKIPNFVFNHLAIELETQDRMECQRLCNERPTCRSYSYREPTKGDVEDVKDETQPESKEAKAQGTNDAAKNPPAARGTCAWSTEGLHYSIAWQFFTKAKDIDWQGNPHLTTENFHRFPGLEYQESSFQAIDGLEITECKQKCAEDPKCGAFSYNEKKFVCRLAGHGVHYDPAFSYYEKPGSLADSPSSKTDLDLEAAALGTQEKAAKHAEKINSGLKKAARERKDAADAISGMDKRFAMEKHAKVSATQRAEAALLAAKKKENKVKDVLVVQKSFETGYFKARGQAQESKTKEVALKKIEIANSEAEKARQEQTNAGEFRAKKLASAFNKKIMSHKLRIRKAKERLLKIKNKDMEDALKNEREEYQTLAIKEKKSIAKIEKSHEMKVKRLMATVAAAKEANLKAKKKLKKEREQAAQRTIDFANDDAVLRKKGRDQVTRLEQEYKAKIEAVIDAGPGA